MPKAVHFHLIPNSPSHNMHQLDTNSGKHKMYQTYNISKECIKIFLRIVYLKGEKI